MVAIEEGTARWFEMARRRCIDHLRALHSIQSAHSFIAGMLQGWATIDPTTNAALHTACVIAYSRPFTTARTAEGTVIYPLKDLKRVPSFDAEFHSHLMDLRDRLIAHADYGIFPSTMYMQTIGDEKLPIRLGIKVKGMLGIESRSLAGKYEKHIAAAAVTIESSLNRDCTELAEHARRHPAVFESTHNVPLASREVKFGVTEEAFPEPTGEAATVEEPSFPEHLSGYRYQTLTHEIALITGGTYVIHENGVPKEIILSVN